MLRIVSTGIGMLFLVVSHSAAQDDLIACQEQNELQQVRASGGEIMPDGCRNVTVSVLEDEGERLCRLDFSGEGEGIVDQLREAAVTEQWWIRCEDFEAATQ